MVLRSGARAKESEKRVREQDLWAELALPMSGMMLTLLRACAAGLFDHMDHRIRVSEGMACEELTVRGGTIRFELEFFLGKDGILSKRESGTAEAGSSLTEPSAGGQADSLQKGVSRRRKEREIEARSQGVGGKLSAVEILNF